MSVGYQTLNFEVFQIANNLCLNFGSKEHVAKNPSDTSSYKNELEK